MNTEQKKTKLIVITGPTGIGKSALSVKAALKFNGEIISADSMQIYRGMDIGTGKITYSEMGGIQHHLIDIADVDEDFSVGRYVELAKVATNNVLTHKKLPFIVGGTGLYINAFLNGLNLAEAGRSEEVRNMLQHEAETAGIDTLFAKLNAVDPESAQKIDKNDLKRIVRALEIYILTGQPKSRVAVKSDAPYEYLTIILSLDRNDLYARINHRVDAMFEAGFFEEARSMYGHRTCNSMQAIGYKQIMEFIEAGEKNNAALIETIKQKTRNYAKRQMTFFNNVQLNNKIYINATDQDAVFAAIDTFLKEN